MIAGFQLSGVSGMRLLAVALAVMAGSIHVAVAENSAATPPAAMDHSGMAMTGPKGDQGPSSQAFAQANAAMHDAMDIVFTGDADTDFARGMIAHHEGAIEMAKIVIEFGADPEIRKLAMGVIAAQEEEVTFMKEWLAKNGK
jgi:uncharacterized protein (DUF305 family)